MGEFNIWFFLLLLFLPFLFTSLVHSSSILSYLSTQLTFHIPVPHLYANRWLSTFDKNGREIKGWESPGQIVAFTTRNQMIQNTQEKQQCDPATSSFPPKKLLWRVGELEGWCWQKGAVWSIVVVNWPWQNSSEVWPGFVWPTGVSVEVCYISGTLRIWYQIALSSSPPVWLPHVNRESFYRKIIFGSNI